MESAYTRLKTALPDKLLFRCLRQSAYSPSEFGFRHRVIYSLLVRYARHTKAKGHSTRYLSAITRFDRYRTLLPILRDLEEMELAEKRGDKYFALEPTGERTLWFPARKDTDNARWFDRFAYTWMALPSCNSKLSPTYIAVYCQLFALTGKRKTQAGIAKMLGIDRTTVYRALKRLSSARLVYRSDVNPPAPHQLLWFADSKVSRNVNAPNAPNAPKIQTIGCNPAKVQIDIPQPQLSVVSGEPTTNANFKLSETLNIRNIPTRGLYEAVDPCGVLMLDSKYSVEEAQDIVSDVLKKLKDVVSLDTIEIFFMGRFRSLLQECNDDHKRNFEKYKSPTSIHLFRTELKRYYAQYKQEYTQLPLNTE